jgi:predicted O-methyltransferase YrrM
VTDEQWAKAARIYGWFDKDEAEFLYPLVTGPWCEIGSFHGRSTTVLAETGYPGWAVDWHRGSPEHPEGTDTYAEFVGNVGAYPNVEVLRMRLEDAEPHVGPLQLLFLDAEHTYDATKQAWNLYAPKVVRGGIVAVHDAAGGAWPEVEQFAAEVRGNQNWCQYRTVNRLAAFHRR